MILLAWLAGCARPLPDHLRLDPPPAAPPPGAIVAPITDRASALAATLGRDPLARRPGRPDPEAVRVHAPAVEAFLDASRGVPSDAPRPALLALEAAQVGTEAVGLARGSRLGLADAALASTLVDGRAAERRALLLGTALTDGPDDPANPRGPLDWAGGRAGFAELGARWVLAGWLTGPEVPLAPVAAALAGSPFDALRGRPLGRLIGARAEGRRADPSAARADLARATHLALQQVAADRDAEQGAWADTRRREAAALGVDDPVRALLERAFEGLLADAGDPRSAGLALVAATALRVIDRCPDAPCGGLDRAETLRAAGRWDPAAGEAGAIWEVIFWDRTLATLAAGRDTGLFPTAATDLADLLLGTGAPVDAVLLRKARPDPTVWLVAARAVGEEGATDWETAHVALGRHLRARAAEAATRASIDDRPLLERISARAVP